MASIKDILYSYGCAARADYPQGDDVEDHMDCIIDFINQHGYEFEDSFLEDLRETIGLCPERDVFKSFDRCSECMFAQNCGFKI